MCDILLFKKSNLNRNTTAVYCNRHVRATVDYLTYTMHCVVNFLLFQLFTNIYITIKIAQLIETFLQTSLFLFRFNPTNTNIYIYICK